MIKEGKAKEFVPGEEVVRQIVVLSSEWYFYAWISGDSNDDGRNALLLCLYILCFD